MSANAKALGIDVGDVVDASITFNSMFSWDFNPSTGVRDGTYDFIGVAIHEIGHALGFVSGVDDFDYSAFYNGPVDEFWWGYGLDMFRYSDNPQGYGDGGPYLDWSIGTDSYFSIDGGQTALFDGYFSTGSNYGDGWQASHWKAPGTCTPLLGIMNPYACNGYVDEVTGLDLALYDAIGWNLSFDVLENPDYLATTSGIYTDFLAEAIPEPQSWAMMVIGFGAVGLTIRRRKEKAAAAI